MSELPRPRTPDEEIFEADSAKIASLLTDAQRVEGITNERWVGFQSLASLGHHWERMPPIERSLLTEEPWVLCYGISNNPRRFWDIEHARRVLGYEPQDAAPAHIGDEDEG